MSFLAEKSFIYLPVSTSFFNNSAASPNIEGNTPFKKMMCSDSVKFLLHFALSVDNSPHSKKITIARDIWPEYCFLHTRDWQFAYTKVYKVGHKNHLSTQGGLNDLSQHVIARKKRIGYMGFLGAAHHVPNQLVAVLLHFFYRQFLPFGEWRFLSHAGFVCEWESIKFLRGGNELIPICHRWHEPARRSRDRPSKIFFKCFKFFKARLGTSPDPRSWNRDMNRDVD